MKKPVLITAVLLLALSLAACAAPAPVPEPPEQAQPEPEPAQTETPQFSVPTFQLNSLPQLATYVAPREIVKRYYSAEFVDTLQTADDYGLLLSYAGKVFGEEWWESRVYYGLADEKGRVVVDPVYRSAYFTEPEQNNGQTYLILSYPVDKDDSKAQELLLNSDGWIQRSRHVVASPNGSWVSGFFYGDGISISANRVIINNYSEDPENMWNTSGQTYRIYNMQGQLIAEGEGQLGDYYDGRARLAYEAPDTPPEEKIIYCCYLDTDGNVVIPGPFTDAYIFQNGRATVTISTDWENRVFGVINTQGEYVVEPGLEVMQGFTYQEKYCIFEDPGAENNRGIKDREGNVIAPAIYSWINLPYEEGITLAVATKAPASPMGRESYWLIDLLNGDARQIEIEYFTINHAMVYGGNWCVATYSNGAALLKGEQIYRFDSSGGGYVDCRPMSGDLFAISYDNYDEQNRGTSYMEVFDAKEGRVIGSLPNCRFSNMINDELIIVELPGSIEHMRAFNLDFTPAFNGELDNSPMRSIGWAGNDVYSVRTYLCSGLIRQNGEWLLRVNVNTLD